MRQRCGMSVPSSSDLPKVTPSPGQRGQARRGDPSVVSQGTDLSLLELCPSFLAFHPLLLEFSKPDPISRQTQSRG